MKYITDVPAEELDGKYVLLRAGLDVPLDKHGDVADLFRVERAAQTILHLRERGAKVIVISHIGRDPETTNESVARALKAHVPIFYVPDILGMQAQYARSNMKNGDVLLLENLRTDPREIANDPEFAQELAAFGNLYVDDAFSVVHRAHASIVGIPQYIPGYAGILVREEVERLKEARAPISPNVAILAGAKFETKEPLIKLLLETYDHVFVGGALANDIFKARGLPVGISLISEGIPGPEVLEHPKLLIPSDVTVERPDKQAYVKKIGDVSADERIVDMGPDSLALLAPLVASAKFILWNGPTGMYDHGYGAWTDRVAEMIARSDAQAVLGGGDTVAAIQQAHIQLNEHIFLSTGGGAMLEYLLKGTLPGIEALNKKII
ncbi:phosphoglycerate kinase [Candidatus Kaiserbacteria bacterium]|nr:phosphoglycerate kinase [Candidatus Kaiserbacteria bacterium]